MMLSFKLELPADVESTLRAETPDLNADVKEAYAVDLYRRGKLSHHQLCGALGLDRFETDAVLKRHGTLIEMTNDRFAEELQSLRDLVRR
jgi:predicted HTH domain antitoxin